LTPDHGTGRTVTTTANTTPNGKEVTMSPTVAELSSATFDEEIGSAEVPVLVEFWAEWCPPCKVLAPILDQIGAERGDGVQLYKVNSDEQRELAARFEVLAVPTILLFSGGELRQRLVGARSKARLVEELDRAFSS
jgi:thioredoxin 1